MKFRIVSDQGKTSPVTHLKQDLMDFFAFQSILLSAFFGFIGFYQFFRNDMDHQFQVVPSFAKIMVQWESLALLKVMLMIFLLILPVTCLWFAIDRLNNFMNTIPENRSINTLAICRGIFPAVSFYFLSVMTGIYLCLSLYSLKAALFVLTFFCINFWVISYIIYRKIS